MKHRVSFLRYLIIAMLTVLCAAFALTACGGNQPKTEQVAVKWEVGEHATVTVENYEGLPESVEKGATLVFTVTCDGGYVVDTVQRDGGRDVNLTNGKYTVSSIVSDTTITIKTKKEIKELSVTTSEELTYLVGDTVDKSKLTVKVVYTDNSEQTLSADDYRIRYQGSTTASAFALGNDYFTVFYDGKESAQVTLKEKVSAVITVDLWGASVVDDGYFTELEANTKLTVTQPQEGGKFTISFNEPLEDDIGLPSQYMMVKMNGEPTDFRFKGWSNPFTVTRGEGDEAQTTPSDIIPKETATCGTITAGWNAQLVDATGIEYVKEGETVYLVLEGNYHAATEVYFWFYEGNRKVGYDGSTTKSAQGSKGGAFTLKFDVTPLSTAKATDGGNYLDSWFDLKIRGMVGGLLEEQEFDLAQIDGLEINTEQAVEAGGFTYKFAVWENYGSNFLKFVVAENVPYTFAMKSSVENDVPTVTFTGTVEDRFKGKTVAIDWWVSSTVTSYGVIGDDGTWKVEFALTPENGFVLNTMGYAHFSIVESEANPTKLYKLNGTAAQEVNLLSSQLTNKDELTDNGDHGEVTGNTFRIANADASLVYYVGIPNWDAIVLYGVNEKNSLALDGGTPVALKVDDMENATKVWYVFNLVAGGNQPYTADEIKNNFVFGNIDSTTDVFKCDKIDDLGNGVYRVWYDITGYTGSQLWPNFYAVSGDAENPSYTKVLEIRNTNDSADWSGVYAVVGNTKYTIKVEYNGPCVVPVTLEEGESTANPESADKDSYTRSLAATDVTVQQEGDKVYFVLSGTAEGYTEAKLTEILNNALFDFQHNDNIDHTGWEYVRELDRTVTLTGTTAWTIKFDITNIEDGAFTTHFNGGDLKIADSQIDGRSITVGNKKFSLVNKVGSPEGSEFWGCIGLVVSAVDAKTVTATGADIELSGDKVYFVITGTSENYAADELKTALEDAEEIEFDFQENPYVIYQSWDQIDDDMWIYHTDMAREATVSGSGWTLKIDITDFKVWAYQSHFGGGDLKLADTSMHQKSVTYQGKVYTLYNFPGSGNAHEYYGCIGLRITEAAAKTYTAKDVNVEVRSGVSYLVISGEYTSYETEELKTELEGIYYDLQHNSNIDNKGWGRLNSFAKTVTVEAGTWKIELNIGEIETGAYTIHFGSTDGVGGDDDNTKNLTLESDAVNGRSVQNGSRTYLFTYVPNSGEANEFWGAVGITITDTAEKTITFTNAKLENDGSHVYLVLTATVNGYTREDLLTLIFVGEHEEDTLTSESVDLQGTTATFKFDFSNAKDGWWWGHYKINGGSQVDIKCPIEEKEETLNGKSYKLQTQYDMPIVVVSNAG